MAKVSTWLVIHEERSRSDRTFWTTIGPVLHFWACFISTRPKPDSQPRDDFTQWAKKSIKSAFTFLLVKKDLQKTANFTPNMLIFQNCLILKSNRLK